MIDVWQSDLGHGPVADLGRQRRAVFFLVTGVRERGHRFWRGSSYPSGTGVGSCRFARVSALD